MSVRKFSESSRREMRPNYGQTWTRNIYLYLTDKCKEGISQREIIIDCMMEVGLTPDKCLEFLGHLKDNELIVKREDGKYYAGKNFGEKEEELTPKEKAKKPEEIKESNQQLKDKEEDKEKFKEERELYRKTKEEIILTGKSAPEASSKDSR